MKTMVRQADPLQPMEVHGGADTHLHPVEDPMLEQVDARRMCNPLEGQRQSRCAGRTCDPTGDPHWSSLFLKDSTLWEGPMLSSL